MSKKNKGKRYSEEQIIRILEEVRNGVNSRTIMYQRYSPTMYRG